VDSESWKDYVNNIPAIESDPDLSRKWTRWDNGF
jgi:hypothetical protein